MVHFPLLQVFSWAVLQIKPSAYLVSTPEPTSHTKPPEFWLWLCESRLLSSEFDPCLAKFTASKIRGFRFFAYCSLLTWAKAGGFAGGILNTCNSWGYNRSPNNPVKINVQHYDAFAICFSVSVSFINSSCKQRIFFQMWWNLQLFDIWATTSDIRVANQNELLNQIATGCCNLVNQSGLQRNGTRCKSHIGMTEKLLMLPIHRVGRIWSPRWCRLRIPWSGPRSLHEARLPPGGTMAHTRHPCPAEKPTACPQLKSGVFCDLNTIGMQPARTWWTKKHCPGKGTWTRHRSEIWLPHRQRLCVPLCFPCQSSTLHEYLASYTLQAPVHVWESLQRCKMSCCGCIDLPGTLCRLQQPW